MDSAAVVAAAGVVAGMLVGLGAPYVTTRLGRRQQAGDREREIAERILDLWQSEEPLPEILRNDARGIRRSLLLLGARLNDGGTRNSCLKLVRMSNSDEFTDDELIEAWSDMVAAVAQVSRRMS